MEFKTYLNTYCEIVFLDPLKIERLVDFHICVCPAVVLPLLEVERVILVRLVCRASNQLVEYGWVVLYTRAGRGEIGYGSDLYASRDTPFDRLLHSHPI